MGIVLLAFAAGLLLGKSRFVSRAGATRLIDRARKILSGNPHLDPKKVIESKYTREGGPPTSVRTLDTSLLPLVLTSYRAAADQPFAKSVGALTIVDGRVVVMDWMGGVFVFDDGCLVKRDFPPLPNNVEAYVQSGREPFSAATLRLHDVEYLSAGSALAVAYESFDVQQKMPRVAVSVIEIDAKTVTPKGAWRTVFESDPLASERYAGQAGGGRLVAKGADKLLLTVGEFNQDGVMMESAKVSQDPRSSFGKTIEIEWASGTHRIISRGHRNPQGLLITEAGVVFATEHGPAGGDELNRIVEGSNYGWPNVTLGTDYDTYTWPGDPVPGGHAGYQMPTFAWVPSVGISNLIEVNGFDRAWDGDLLVASLKAQTLFRLRMDDGRVVYSEPIWIGQRIRDLATMSSGEIVLWTDDAQLIFVAVDREAQKRDKRGLGFLGQAELASCMACHHFDVTGPTHLAPSLKNIVGRVVASDGFTRYSPGLKAAGGVWTEERLRAFIANPSEFAPGSTMPKLSLSEREIATIVDLLKGARP